MRPLCVAGLRLGLLLLLTSTSMGCRHEAPDAHARDEGKEGAWFKDVTEEVGLDFVHDPGPTKDYFMPGMVGSGAAVFDCDGDGLLDIYLLQNGGPQGARNRLFRQDRPGHFVDVSARSGLDFAGNCMGVAVGDVNNDGLPDVLVTEYGGIRLFLNRGSGHFQDVTKRARLSNPAWGTSAAFLDYDHDGRLDLVVVNYVDYDRSWPCAGASGQPDYCAPKVFRGRVTKLFHNVTPRAGPDVGVPLYADVTIASGLGARQGPGLGVVCADFDGDGWTDILVANDGKPNVLWINQHDGTFQEEAARRGVAFNGMGQAQAGMGVTLGDVDGDGLFDLFITHLPEEGNTLWRQGPRGRFQDRAAWAGFARPHWRGTGFGTVLADFDRDGALDTAVANGAIRKAQTVVNPSLGPHWGQYAERNQLFANDGTGRFRDISVANEAFCGTPNVARGLVAADFDGNGALDLLVTTVGGRARLYRNVAPGRGHWLLVRALDPELKRDAYGAEVRVRAGARSWLRLINPNESFLCSGDARAHFGLGGVERVESIEVLWPDGRREEFDGGPANRTLVLSRGKGRLLPAPKKH